MDTSVWREADPSDDRPLAGLRVLEFGQFIAAPAAAQTLGDLGADVIKIEPPGGDAARSLGWTQDAFGPMFSAYNRNKRSVVLNLRDPQRQATAQALAMQADVLLQNARPGVMERLGLGAESLMKASPRLVYGAVSGFGPTGASVGRPGLDIAAQAESGMMSLNGNADADPTRVGFAVVDVMAAHSLATGVLAALVRRGVSGRGGLVEVSLIDAATEALLYPWAEYRLSGRPPLRCGNGQPTVAPAADVVQTADGMIVISAYMPEHFIRLCECLGCTELLDNPLFKDNAARVANRAHLKAVLHKALAGMTSAQACERLTNAGIVCGDVRRFDQVHMGINGIAPDLFVPVQLAEGPFIGLPASPVILDRKPRQGGRLPEIGEHTDEVLSSLS